MKKLIFEFMSIPAGIGLLIYEGFNGLAAAIFSLVVLLILEQINLKLDALIIKASDTESAQGEGES